MIQNQCNHLWKKHTDASQREETGAIPAYFMCTACRTLMTAPEVFQLEALENQSKTLKHLKGVQSWMTILMGIIAILSLLATIILNDKIP
jgi:putative aminopeptidase FrvX